MRITAVIALGVLVFAAVASAAPDDITILISIDGFRADYLDRGITPVMTGLARNGVRSAMEPSFPSVTFPNHFTLITGLYPDHHGIVDNHFEDKALGRVWDPRDPFDPVWWKGVTPLWATAEAQGVRSASMFWPATGADAQGRQPALAVSFTPDVPMDQESAQVLAWLDLPAAQRPHFILLYFFYVDHVGHDAGPDGPATETAIGQADAALGKLVDGLKQRNLFDRTNIIVVADHGMAAISRNQVTELDDLVNIDHVHVITEGALAGLEPKPGFAPEVEKALLGRHNHMSCWKKARLPRRFHYGSNPRIPPILCLADEGWEVQTKASGRPGDEHGNHGFDPANPSMAAVFVAHGPAFRRGITWPKFSNVDVYALLARVMGVKPLPSDGRLADVKGMLTSP
jgi:predicted AlkP superfamily pyrophosphatase or phosphodiesterase